MSNIREKHIHCLNKDAAEIAIILSNLNCTSVKRMKFATKPIRQCSHHLRHVATLPWKIINSIFVDR